MDVSRHYSTEADVECGVCETIREAALTGQGGAAIIPRLFGQRERERENTVSGWGRREREKALVE